MQKIELEVREKNNFVPPNVVRKNFPRESYSIGQLESHIKHDLKGVLLLLKGTFSTWKTVIKFD